MHHRPFASLPALPATSRKRLPQAALPGVTAHPELPLSPVIFTLLL
ncbi:hypothetical protein KCP73_01060 [Salmonella enterica subsp. enterica]|nr:hypothetical protein KCP73_01060 [Salmonella enterica subsp. enterica]